MYRETSVTSVCDIVRLEDDGVVGGDVLRKKQTLSNSSVEA